MPAPIPRPLPEPVQAPQPREPSPEQPFAPTFIETERNEFGLYRAYPNMPSSEPDVDISLDVLCDSPGLATAGHTDHNWWSGLGSSFSGAIDNIFTPFQNATTFRLMDWFYGGTSSKSIADLDSLVNNVILAEDFNTSHLADFSAKRELDRLDVYADHPDLSIKDGWNETSVFLRLPATHVKNRSEDTAPQFEVKGVFYRRLLEVIKAAFQDTTAKAFHYTPFRLFWQPDHKPPQRVISELYNSDAFLDEHVKIMAKNQKSGCTLETTIAAIMVWSDATHLASFGTASLWPIYAFFGNQSKYTRGKPTSFAAHHLAYIPSVCPSHPYTKLDLMYIKQLPDTIQDVYQSIFGQSATAAVLTFLKRELMHKIWALLLDPTFMHAYVHGIIIKCADGILRRVFPRFFTYSADYPEK